MKQSELLFKVSSELPLEVLINIYSYCEKIEKVTILKLIFIKFYPLLKKFFRYFICFIFTSYIICYWCWVILNKEKK